MGESDDVAEMILGVKARLKAAWAAGDIALAGELEERLIALRASQTLFPPPLLFPDPIPPAPPQPDTSEARWAEENKLVQAGPTNAEIMAELAKIADRQKVEAERARLAMRRIVEERERESRPHGVQDPDREAELYTREWLAEVRRTAPMAASIAEALSGAMNEGEKMAHYPPRPEPVTATGDGIYAVGRLGDMHAAEADAPFQPEALGLGERLEIVEKRLREAMNYVCDIEAKLGTVAPSPPGAKTEAIPPPGIMLTAERVDHLAVELGNRLFQMRERL